MHVCGIGIRRCVAMLYACWLCCCVLNFIPAMKMSWGAASTLTCNGRAVGAVCWGGGCCSCFSVPGVQCRLGAGTPPGTSCPMLHGAVSILSPDPVRFAYASLSWAAQGLQMDEFPPVALSPSPAQGPTHTRCMTEQKRGREGLSLDAPTSRLWGSRAAECRWGPQLSPQ